MYKLLLGLFCLSCSPLFAAEQSESLTIDRTVPNAGSIIFPNDENIKPKSSNFRLLDYVLMSNELGERWAVVTIRNQSSGNRTFEHEQLMALFADGRRKVPEAFSQHFKASETQSLTISFGKSKFPILHLLVETKD